MPYDIRKTMGIGQGNDLIFHGRLLDQNLVNNGTKRYISINAPAGSTQKSSPLKILLQDHTPQNGRKALDGIMDLGLQINSGLSNAFKLFTGRVRNTDQGADTLISSKYETDGLGPVDLQDTSVSLNQYLVQEDRLAMRIHARENSGFFRFARIDGNNEVVNLHLSNPNDEPLEIYIRGLDTELPATPTQGLSNQSLLKTQGTEIRHETLTAGETMVIRSEDVRFKTLLVVVEGQNRNTNGGNQPIYHLNGRVTKGAVTDPSSGSGNTQPGGSDPGGTISMSYKAFVSIGDMADNSHRQVAAIGELSAYSMTFSRDRLLSSTTFSTANVGYEGVALRQTVFSCLNQEQRRVPPHEGLVDYVEEIAAFIYKGGMQKQFTADLDSVRQYLMTYGSPLHQIQPGSMVNHAGNYYPEFVTFIVQGSDLKTWYQDIRGRNMDLTPELNRIQVKLWLSDRAFQVQFDEYEIEVIPPIEVLDGFFQSEDHVRNIVSRRRVEELMEKINEVADRDPYTQVKTLEFNWHNPLNDTKIPTNWTFVVYGQQGLSNDALKDHLRKWILENSAKPRDEWITRFPDIFKTTEFVFIPNWSRYAIPNETLSPGMYTPYQDYQEAMLVGRKTIAGEGYTSQHVVRHLGFLGNTYKSVGLLVCGGPENRNEHEYFNQVWPDYLAVGTSSTDFNRMQPSTQNWVNRFQLLMRTAEEATDLSDLPAGFSRVTRKNYLDQPVTYIAMTIRNIQYMVITKQSMVRLVPSEGLDITPDAIPLTILPSNRIVLQTAKGNKTLTVDFEVMGGSAPYRYLIPETDDMDKISVGANTGHAEIRFKDYGSYSFAVHVTDSSDIEYVATYSVMVRP